MAAVQGIRLFIAPTHCRNFHSGSAHEPASPVWQTHQRVEFTTFALDFHCWLKAQKLMPGSLLDGIFKVIEILFQSTVLTPVRTADGSGDARRPYQFASNRL